MNSACWTALTIMILEIGLFFFFTKPFFYAERGLEKSQPDCVAVNAESIEQYALSLKKRIAASPLSALVMQELFPQQFLPTVTARHDEVMVENVLELSGGSRGYQAIRTFTVRDQYLMDSSRDGMDEVRVVPQMRWRELLYPKTAAAYFYSTDYKAMADRLVRLHVLLFSSHSFTTAQYPYSILHLAGLDGHPGETLPAQRRRRRHCPIIIAISAGPAAAPALFSQLPAVTIQPSVRVHLCLPGFMSCEYHVCSHADTLCGCS